MKEDSPKIARTICRYSWESHLDKAMLKGCTVYMPCTWLCKALGLKKFKANIKSPEGKDIELLATVSDFGMELSIDRDLFEPKQLRKWLAEFEYHLEQHFFKNVVIENTENSREFKIKINF